MACDDPTASPSDKPTILPYKHPMHDRNALQIKDSEYFLGNHPNSTLKVISAGIL